MSSGKSTSDLALDAGFYFRAALLSFLNLYDTFGTYYHVVVAKHAQELNPMMDWLLKSNPYDFVLVKVLVTPFFWFIAYKYPQSKFIFWVVFALYLFVFIEHSVIFLVQP